MTEEEGNFIEPVKLTGESKQVPDIAYGFAVESAESRAAQAEREAVLKGIGEFDDDENAAIIRKQLRVKRMLKEKIPLSFVIAQCEEKLAARRLSNELLFFIPFLVVFLIVSIAHRDIEGAFWVGVSMGGQTGEGEVPPREAVRDPLRDGERQAHHISKAFLQVKDVEEWHHWFETIVIDFFYADPSENPPPVNNWVAGFNLKVGALRVRTLRVKSDSCIGTNFESVTDGCYGPFSVFDVEETDYGDTAVANYTFEQCDDVYGTIGLIAYYPCKGNVYDIPWNTSLSAAKTKARAMNSIYTNSTDILDLTSVRFIAVEFVVYTPEINEFTLVKTYMEITAGGKFVPTVTTDTFQVWSGNYQIWHMFFWCVLYVGVFLYIGKYIYDWKSAIGDGQGLAWFLSGWNLLELINMISFFIMFVVRIIWMAKSDELDFELPGDESYPRELEYIEFLFRFQVYGGAINLVITSIKVLKYVELNPQLNIVTRTLSNAGQNLIGILVIFVIVLSAYSLAATSLFSNAIEDYRDFETSFSTLLRILLGDFDYDMLREENRFLAGIFFWSFTILALFMLLNFFVGAIASSFTQEVDGTTGPTLQESIINFFAYLRRTFKEFKSNPGLFFTQMIEVRKSRFAEYGRLTTLVRTLKWFRLHFLHKEATDEEYALMSAEAKESVLPDPPIDFYEIEGIFAEVYGDAGPDEQPLDRYNWISEKYLKNVWVEVHQTHAIQEGHSEAAEAEALKMQISLATEEALRLTLGLTTSTEHKASKEMLQVQELFAPTATTMKKIESMTMAVGKLEDHVTQLSHLVSKLEKKL